LTLEAENQLIRGAVSDPSTLTTQQLWREVLNLRELLESRISSIEKSIQVAHEDLVRVPTDVQKQVGNLKQLHEEKFNSVAIQFAERDTRIAQKDRDTKIAIDAAFQSASMAVAKNEVVMSKQLDQITALIQTETRALSGQIDDLKQRVTRIEGMGVGAITAQTNQSVTKTAEQASSSYTVTVISLVVGTLIALIGIAVAITLRR